MYWPVLVRPTSAAVNIYIPLTTFSPNESKQHILFYDLQPFNKLANTLRWPPCRGLGSYRSFRNLAQQMQNKCKKKVHILRSHTPSNLVEHATKKLTMSGFVRTPDNPNSGKTPRDDSSGQTKPNRWTTKNLHSPRQCWPRWCCWRLNG